MKKRISTILIILWACCQLVAQEQLTAIKTVPGTNASPRYLASVNNKYLFVAANGRENALFTTDGTEAGTLLLSKDLIIEPNKKQAVSDGNYLYFLVNNNSTKLVEVWRTDGTATATTKVTGIGDTFTAQGFNYYLLKSDNYFYFVSIEKITQRVFITQFNEEFKPLLSELSTNKYEWYPLVFKDFLLFRNKLFRTESNTAFNDFNISFYPNVDSYYTIDDKLYIEAYDKNKIYEYDGINTRELSMPFTTSYDENVKYKIFTYNNKLHVVHAQKSESQSTIMETNIREFVLNTQSRVFEEVLFTNKPGHLLNLWAQAANIYVTGYNTANQTNETFLHKIPNSGSRDIISQKFEADQPYSFIINNGRNLFILQKDKFKPDAILYDADARSTINLPADIVFNDFLAEIRPRLWLMNAHENDKGDELYILDVATGQASLLKDINLIMGSGIQKLYQLNDKTLVWSSPEKNGTVVYKSDGTKAGTEALKTISTQTSFSYNSVYDTAISADGSLIITNYRDDTYDDEQCTSCRPSSKPLVFKTDGTFEGTQKLYESDERVSFSFSEKIGADVFHMVASEDGLVLKIFKNTNATTEPQLIKQHTSTTAFEFHFIQGEFAALKKRNGSGPDTFHILHIPSGEFVVQSPANFYLVGNKILFDEVSLEAFSIYVLNPYGVTKLFTMYPPAAAAVSTDLILDAQYRGTEIVFAGDYNFLYTTDGTPQNTKKIPILFRDYTFKQVKKIAEVNHFLFAKVQNDTNVYKVQDDTATESIIPEELFLMGEPVVINNVNYYSRFIGMPTGATKITFDIYTFNNSQLNNVASIGYDYTHFTVKKFDRGFFLNPLTGIYFWQPSGTEKLSDNELISVVQLGDKYVFSDTHTTKKLYITDGTTAGTKLLKEFSGISYDMKTIGNKVYFTATSPEAGNEPWETDGTPEGTRMVRDLWAGPQSSDPTDYIEVNGIPVCLAETPDAGRQLFSLLIKLDSPVLLVPNTQVCEGDTIVLAAPKNFDTYRWIINDTQEIKTSGNKLSVTKSGNYKVIVSKNNTESVPSNTVNVQFKPLPAKPIISQQNNQLSTTANGTIQWYLNGNAIAGATTNVLSYNGIGDYLVQVTENGCLAVSDKLSVTITATEDWRTSLVYPNPAVDKLIVKTNTNQPLQLKLIDIRGRVVLEQKLQEESTFIIDVKDFTRGVYILKLNEHNKKIIIE